MCTNVMDVYCTRLTGRHVQDKYQNLVQVHYFDQFLEICLMHDDKRFFNNSQKHISQPIIILFILTVKLQVQYIFYYILHYCTHLNHFIIKMTMISIYSTHYVFYTFTN